MQIQRYKNRKIYRRLGFVFVFLCFLIFVFSCFFAFMIYKINSSTAKEEKALDFVIKKGEGVNQISAKLEENGLISNSFYFDVYVWLRKKENNLIAGTYKLNSGMSVREIADILTEGRVSKNKITILEGWTSKDIAWALSDFLSKYSETESQKQFQVNYEKQFLDEVAKVEKYKSKYDFLSDLPKGATLEGYLFPDTYQIYRDSNPEDIIQKMLDNFGKKLDDNLRKKISEQKKTIFEVVTLASIVQREVKTEAEMKKVAGVYENRLKLGKKLESDATITFITGKKNPQASYEDTKIDSPYNTYRYHGLPAGPIGNPGISAILAVIEPEEHDFLYFITRLDTGEAIFSKTIEEHLANKKKYLDAN